MVQVRKLPGHPASDDSDEGIFEKCLHPDLTISGHPSTTDSIISEKADFDGHNV